MISVYVHLNPEKNSETSSKYEWLRVSLGPHAISGMMLLIRYADLLPDRGEVFGQCMGSMVTQHL